MRRSQSPSAQRVEICSDIRRVRFADTEIRHHRSGLDLLGKANPSHEIRRLVAQAAGDERAIRELLEARADAPKTRGNAGNHVARSTAVLADQPSSALGIATGNSLRLGSAAAETTGRGQRNHPCDDRARNAADPNMHAAHGVVVTGHGGVTSGGNP